MRNVPLHGHAAQREGDANITQTDATNGKKIRGAIIKPVKSDSLMAQAAVLNSLFQRADVRTQF